MAGRDQATPCATWLFPRTRCCTLNEKVLNCLYQNPDAIFKLICFPWAGGGSMYFAKWGQRIHESLEVHSVRLAGRESRLEEPFAKDMYQLADEIVCAMLPIIQDKPFAFFGHRYLKKLFSKTSGRVSSI
uniref:oleoyl-[acyl-carrier-protein] hydrolase n=1 Tax=Propithecus coquereli TaxID=379532 RepID=A0A2K6ET39_PROCO